MDENLIWEIAYRMNRPEGQVSSTTTVLVPVRYYSTSEMLGSGFLRCLTHFVGLQIDLDQLLAMSTTSTIITTVKLQYGVITVLILSAIRIHYS